MSQNDDLISRQAAIDKAIMIPVARIVTEDKVLWRKAVFVEDIVTLPSAHPVAKDIHVPNNDLISRQGIIDTLKAEQEVLYHNIRSMSKPCELLDRYSAQHNQIGYDIFTIERFPSAQLERTGQN